MSGVQDGSPMKKTRMLRKEPLDMENEKYQNVLEYRKTASVPNLV